MTDGQSELAEQIDADKSRPSLLDKLALIRQSLTSAVAQLGRCITDAKSNVVAEETRPDFTVGVDDFREEDFIWCPHCLTDIDDCKCPPRATPLSWPGKEVTKVVMEYVRTQDDYGNSWLDLQVADKLRLPLSTIHDVVHFSNELGLVKSHVVWLPKKEK